MHCLVYELANRIEILIDVSIDEPQNTIALQ